MGRASCTTFPFLPPPLWRDSTRHAGFNFICAKNPVFVGSAEHVAPIFVGHLRCCVALPLILVVNAKKNHTSPQARWKRHIVFVQNVSLNQLPLSLPRVRPKPYC